MFLRSAQPSDALAVARVHVRSWQVSYAGLLPDAYLRKLKPEDRAPHYNFAGTDPLQPKSLVAVDAGQIHGFVTIGPSRDPDAKDHGEILALYVDPDRWRSGVGSALLGAACERLVEMGFCHALLWALAGNERAEQFYLRKGWTPDGSKRTEVLWGVSAQDLRYRRNLINPVV
jgi:GNAT superfamily N-acetyltransferase